MATHGGRVADALSSGNADGGIREERDPDRGLLGALA